MVIESMLKQPKTFEEISAELKRCSDAYEEARTRVSWARNDETTALNNLNSAQTEFDALVAEVRKNAPRDSKWKQKQYSEPPKHP